MKAAELSGINVKLSRFSIFVILGFAAFQDLGGDVCLPHAGRIGLVWDRLGPHLSAATVVGGTPLTGGRGVSYALLWESC